MNIEELKALEARATAAPWKHRSADEFDAGFVEHPKQRGKPYGTEILSDEDYPTKKGDCEFIAALRNAAPALLAVAEAAEKVDKMYHTSSSLYFQDATVEEAQKHRDGLMRDLRTALANLKGAEA